MATTRLKFLCVEIFKCINDIGPSFMKNIFELKIEIRNVRTSYRNNLTIPIKNTITYGKKSISALGPSTWNSLPAHIKSCTNLYLFKKMLKNWDGKKCSCKICK